jgi:plastocyanin
VKKAPVTLVLVLIALLLIGCGDSSSDDAAGGSAAGGASTAASAPASTSSSTSEAASPPAVRPVGEVVDIEAVAGYPRRYVDERLTAAAGKMTIRFTNPTTPQDDPIGKNHGLRVEDANGKIVAATKLIDDGSISTVVDLKAGEYKYYCPVPGHRETMEGTLTVK